MRTMPTPPWALLLAGGDGCRLRPLTRQIAGDQRPKQFNRGGDLYDYQNVGFLPDQGGVLFDTTQRGNGNQGHTYGVDLSASQKQDLLEYLKTL